MQPQPLRQLILALGAAMAPLFLVLPWWIIGWCAAFWGYLLIRDPAVSQMPSRTVRTILFTIGLAMVLLAGGMRLEGNDFIALLAVMAGVKPLEVRGYRDGMVTVFLAYFLTITSLFVFESLSMTVYLFVSVWITTAVLIHVNHPAGPMNAQLKLSARMLLLALPLMLMLFFAFPRLPGNFMGVPWPRQHRAGFAGVIRLGDISQVVLRDTPVFSAIFDSSPPAVDKRYWRGMVFQSFDGDTWRPAPHASVRLAVIDGENPVHYQVILEPHGYRNLFVLDLPVKAAPVGLIMADHTLIRRRPVHQRFSYRAVSILDPRQRGDERPGDHWLQLPPGRNFRSLALGRQWARDHTDPAALVRTGLDYFRKNGFTYTLRPDRLGRDAVDDFLFVSRNGFCEHYASAFTVLMRAAGVPARMVGGFQGGRWNAWGNVLTVRQADAHVWCEVWMKGRGWTRVDPTFAVAPDRVEEGMESLFDDLPWSIRKGDHLLGRWIEHIRLTWEAVNIRWNIWLMSFSAEQQAEMLIRLARWKRWLVLAALPLMLMLAVFFTRRRQRTRQALTIEDQARIVFHRFLKKMSRIGMDKPPYQGPWDFYRTVAGHYPQLDKDVKEIVGRYTGLRYGREKNPAELTRLRGQVRCFHPRRKTASES